MKKFFYLALASLAIVSCKKEAKDYLTFSGKITNKNSDSLVIANPRLGFKRVIKVQEDGTFKDTMKIPTGVYRLFDGREVTTAYLKNGADINMTLDTKEFDETVNYTGAGSEESNYLAKAALKEITFMQDETLMDLEQDAFDAKVTAYEKEFNDLIDSKTFDSTFTANQKQNLGYLKQYLKRAYDEKAYIKKNLAKGMESPKFVAYENHKGGEVSLDDLKGKYVYIDMWATWCQPCKNEIPFLKKVEKEFHDKNIEFVSISVDRANDYEVWKKMVAEKELTGLQLYAKQDKSFADAYRVSGIPRFILLDPEGNIVDANAPRPSNPKLVELFKSLEI